MGGNARFLVAAAAFLALLFLKGAAISPPPVDPSPAADAFNTARALDRLRRILGDEAPHSVDTDANDRVRARLIDEIEALGYAPEVRDDFSCRDGWGAVRCARVRNVVLVAGPAPVTRNAVMIASHYDSVPAGPGAADDGLGVAVALEIAALFAANPPARPVVVLITDGEELGLLGAKAFMASDPYRDKIAAVVNVEARGVRGPAAMFETSMPNARDIAAYVSDAARPSANSLATDVYRMLPNDTDMSEFLPGGYEANNIAITEGLAYYHTPHDNLANLDPRSVQHAGASALTAVRNFLDAPSPEEMEQAGEGRVIFTDIASRAAIVLPQWLGGAVLIVGAVAAAFAFFGAGGSGRLRTVLAPPAAVLAAAATAFAAQALVGAVRTETAYWYAFPAAMRALAYLAAIASVFAVYWAAPPSGAMKRLRAAAWFWFALTGLALFPVAPGGAILFAPPLAFAAAGLLVTRAAAPMTAIGAGLALIIWLPMIHQIEVGLGLSAIALPAALVALLATVLVPVVAGGEAPGRTSVLASLTVLAIALAAALVAPAYSESAPRPLNIRYFADADAREAYWTLVGAGEEVPAGLAAAAPFIPREIDGARVPAAPADFRDITPPQVEILGEIPGGSGRTLRIRMEASGHDAVHIRFPAEARARSVSSGGVTTAFSGDTPTLACEGRACADREFEIGLDAAEPAEWRIYGVRHSLPPGGAALAVARPASATAIQSGDRTVVLTRVRL